MREYVKGGEFQSGWGCWGATDSDGGWVCGIFLRVSGSKDISGDEERFAGMLDMVRAVDRLGGEGLVGELGEVCGGFCWFGLMKRKHENTFSINQRY
ncbi:hypothetical protein ACQCVM_17905 [Rossellomorea aquimaris]